MHTKNDQNSGHSWTRQSSAGWFSLQRHESSTLFCSWRRSSTPSGVDKTITTHCTSRSSSPTQLLLNFAVLAATLMCASGQRALGSDTVDALVLEQKSQTSGLMKVYLPANAIRIDFKKLHCSLTASAPDWNIWIFNQSKRVYCQTTYKQYRGLVKDTLMSMWESQTSRAWLPCGKTKIKGIDVTQYQVIACGRPREELTRAEAKALMCLATNLKGVAPTAANILSKTVLAPRLGKVPIACDLGQSMFGEKSTRFLSTLRSTREKVSTSLFKKPTGFRKVKFDSEVTVDGSSDGAEQLLF